MTEVAATYNTGKQETEKSPDMQQIMLRRFMGTRVFVHLTNKIRLEGKLIAYDRFTILLDTGQMIYKHAITTIQPATEHPSRW